MTCGKEQNPERFHSHPKHLTKFKAKDKILKSNNASNNNKDLPYKTISKLIVTKPKPLKYKSKSIDSNSSRDSLNKEPSGGSSTSRKSKHKTISTKISKLKLKDKKSKLQQHSSPRRPTTFGQTFTKKDKGRPLVEIFHNNNNVQPDLTQLEQDELYDQVKEDDLNHSFKSDLSSTAGSLASSRRSGSAPMRTCYICGREFGSRSLKIHEPQCFEVSMSNIL